MLQQSLPFTVLKQLIDQEARKNGIELQQSLPFTVLKQAIISFHRFICAIVATALTVYGMRRRVRGSRGVNRR